MKKAITYLTKDKQSVAAGQKKFSDFSFVPASEEEIKKALGDGVDVPDGYVAGWASTTDLDSYRHVVAKGAFAASISKRGLSGPKGIKLLIGHSWNQVAGVIKVLEYRGDRLWIEAQLNLDIGYVSDAYKAAKMVGGLSFSVGFMLQDYEFKEDDNDREYLLIKRGDLFEVSVVPFPGNEEATMTFIKDGSGGDPLANRETSTYDDDESEETLSSVSEFEKTLVLNGVVKTRAQAHSITQLVKANLDLFRPKEEPASAKATKSGPVLDMNSITAVAKRIAEIKEILSSPVAE